MAGPLLVIGKTQAQDTAVSPSHDPGECIVCPLAYGAFDACGGYSDYDYNKYWSDNSPSSAPDTVPPTDSELETADSSSDDSTDEAWESGYEDYYADYSFGDDSTTTYEEDVDADDVTLEAFPAPVGVIYGDVTPEMSPAPIGVIYGASEERATPVAQVGAETDQRHDYDPIASGEPATSAEEEASDYETYEGDWYGSQPAIDSQEAIELACDKAYEALSESAGETYSDEVIDIESVEPKPPYEIWGDEETYGHDSVSDDAILEPAADLAPVELLETGYDTDFDEAMATEWEAAAPVGHIAPAKRSTESSKAASEPKVHEQVREAVDSEPAWLTELVDRLLAPVGTSADVSLDECAQEWNCEAENWAGPQVQQPSVVLQAAVTLDGMASLLQNAAEMLRDVASGRLARAVNDGASR
jgi:hypothetical protein